MIVTGNFPFLSSKHIQKQNKENCPHTTKCTLRSETLTNVRLEHTSYLQYFIVVKSVLILHKTASKIQRPAWLPRDWVPIYKEFYDKLSKILRFFLPGVSSGRTHFHTSIWHYLYLSFWNGQQLHLWTVLTAYRTIRRRANSCGLVNSRTTKFYQSHLERLSNPIFLRQTFSRVHHSVN